MCFNDFNKCIQGHTSLTSLYNGFVDLFMKYVSYTSLYNGFVDSVCPDVMLEHSGDSPPPYLCFEQNQRFEGRPDG